VTYKVKSGERLNPGGCHAYCWGQD